MKVTSIDVSGLRYDGARACHEGHVTMELRPSRDGAPMHVHFVCQSNREQGSPSSLVTHDLVADALRQAGRMPGYRRGEQAIELSASARKFASGPGSA